jgi:acetyl-CoA carboxylase biotin carboxyl carrier protein
VADENKDTPRPFDVATIEALVRLMAQNDLSEIDLHDGTQRIRLRRGTRVASVTALPLPVSASPLTPTPTPTTPAIAPTVQPAASNLVDIKSPTVGTFYAQRDPGAPALVTVGSRVTPETVIGLIEAMKVYNEIFAGVSGVVREIVANNGEYVEYDQVLFRVDPSA